MGQTGRQQVDCSRVVAHKTTLIKTRHPNFKNWLKFDENEIIVKIGFLGWRRSLFLKASASHDCEVTDTGLVYHAPFALQLLLVPRAINITRRLSACNVNLNFLVLFQNSIARSTSPGSSRSPVARCTKTNGSRTADRVVRSLSS